MTVRHESTSSWPGYAVPADTYTAPSPRRSSTTRVLLTWLLGIAVVTAVMFGASAAVSEPGALYVCPPDCGRPPTGEPVMINPRFVAPDGSFSVSYPAEGTAYDISTEATGVTATFVGGDGGTLQLFGEPAHGRSAEQIVTHLVDVAFPDNHLDYEIPNAMVGHHPGYGIVADYWPQGATADYERTRILVLAAVKHDLALVAAAVGPYRQFGPDFGAGKPSGANLQLALDMGKYVNSFRWANDPVR
ncbi:hypothetical protein [Mycolicibacterium thermoresistibile]